MVFTLHSMGCVVYHGGYVTTNLKFGVTVLSTSKLAILTMSLKKRIRMSMCLVLDPMLLIFIKKDCSSAVSSLMGRGTA
jgi:hypothetical protein